jgi:hypothetical protein
LFLVKPVSLEQYLTWNAMLVDSVSIHKWIYEVCKPDWKSYSVNVLGVVSWTLSIQVLHVRMHFLHLFDTMTNPD